MAGGIFLSYRRDDNRYAAGRFYDRLAQHFGPQQIFMDVDNIEPGLDFVKVLSERVANCDVLVAVIGPGWLEARDERGQRRLDNLADFVRIEIEAALARDVRVVPLLLEGAPMPREDQLPETLRPLARRNAVTLTHASFGRDADALIRVLEKDVKPKGVLWKGFARTRATPATAQAAAAKCPADERVDPRGDQPGRRAARIALAAIFAVGAIPLVIAGYVLALFSNGTSLSHQKS